MLALRLEFLTGRAVVTAYNDRQNAEWPPHPARVFSALVATWAEQDPSDSSEALAERAALEWLERLPPPSIACEDGLARRTVMTHYVPTNDVSLTPARLHTQAGKRDEAAAALAAAQAAAREAAGDAKAEKSAAKAMANAQKAFAKEETKFLDACKTAFNEADLSTQTITKAQRLLPEGRSRQPRTFPSLSLGNPVVHLCWDQQAEPRYQAALDRLAARLIRVGHSSSFVQARWVSAAPPANWLPDDSGSLLLRLVGAGQLARLCEEFEQHRGVEPRVLPFKPQRYRAIGAELADVTADTRQFTDRDWIILRRVGGPALPLTRAADIAGAVRGALMAYADQPPPEIISGHATGGEPARAPHLTVMPLPHVGSRHADGRVLGVALLLPRGIDEAQRRPLLRALAHWEDKARRERGLEPDESAPLTVGLGSGVEIELERQNWGEARLTTLKPSTWCEAAHEWLSVTPVALDRNPGDLSHSDATKRAEAYRAAAECIAQSCRNLGLPTPIAVTILPSGTWPGGAKAAKFPAFPREPGKLKRVKVHARIRFAHPQPGPVILGAGRFLGLGLFKPVPESTP